MRLACFKVPHKVAGLAPFPPSTMGQIQTNVLPGTYADTFFI